MPTRKPIGLIGETRWPPVQYISTLHPMNVPAMPISKVAMAPPGSRPGMMALANRPTTVPNPTQVRPWWIHSCAVTEKSTSGMVGLLESDRRIRRRGHGFPLAADVQVTTSRIEVVP